MNVFLGRVADPYSGRTRFILPDPDDPTHYRRNLDFCNSFSEFFTPTISDSSKIRCQTQHQWCTGKKKYSSFAISYFRIRMRIRSGVKVKKSDPVLYTNFSGIRHCFHVSEVSRLHFRFCISVLILKLEPPAFSWLWLCKSHNLHHLSSI